MVVISTLCSLLSGREQPAQPEKPPSPKFIVTLDGVPSPPGYVSDQEEEELCIIEGLKPVTQHSVTSKGLKIPRVQQMQVVTRQLGSPEGNYSSQWDLCAGVDEGLHLGEHLGLFIYLFILVLHILLLLVLILSISLI